jgi:lipopolysaccharide/colanic/teichoic acid biosynthesis glycosyltransferase
MRAIADSRVGPTDTQTSAATGAAERAAAEEERGGTTRRNRRGYLWLKRGMDIVISAAALTFLSPVLLLIALLIKRESEGPAIFTQERAGYHWRKREHTVFRMHKFRSMYHNSDQTLHQQFIREWANGSANERVDVEGRHWLKLTDDPRVTRIGRFIRKTSLDELPQLWNVLKGEMSLVGPRPVPLYEVEEYQEWHRRRLEATPGITCIWQVRGRGHSDLDEQVQMDLEYIENQSIWLDLKILVLTFPVVLTGRGAA